MHINHTSIAMHLFENTTANYKHNHTTLGQFCYSSIMLWQLSIWQQPYLAYYIFIWLWSDTNCLRAVHTWRLMIIPIILLIRDTPGSDIIVIWLRMVHFAAHNYAGTHCYETHAALIHCSRDTTHTLRLTDNYWSITMIIWIHIHHTYIIYLDMSLPSQPTH